MDYQFAVSAHGCLVPEGSFKDDPLWAEVFKSEGDAAWRKVALVRLMLVPLLAVPAYFA